MIYESSPELRLVWPVEALEAILKEPIQRTALVLGIESAADFKQRVLAPGLATRLVRNGVELFALTGEESEQAHDALDDSLEEAGAYGVVTTWHDADDPEDVASFVVASSQTNGLARILAVVDEATLSGMRLKKCISETIEAA